MKFKYALTSLALSVAILSSVPSTAFAIGGASGAKVDYQVQGKIGEVVMNPYDIAPLTAVIRNGGFPFRDGHVRVFPQKKSPENADKCLFYTSYAADALTRVYFCGGGGPENK
ncbi:hypothetical protein [Salmonella enterica]|uniref:hypothetical protein n=1 Tax=Salmonella enterica TaxID=28901 RepID=UPI0038BCE6B0